MKIALIALVLISSLANAALVNSGFEDPVIGVDYLILSQDSVPGWSTTAGDGMIELWTSGFQGFLAYEGNQFAEINANEVATLFQDIFLVADGTQIGFEFAHRARQNNSEEISVTITDTVTSAVLFNQSYVGSTSAWAFHTSTTEAPIFGTGNTLRLSFESLVGGSVGNFVDAVDFGTDISLAPIPEPATWTLVGLSLVGLGYFRRRMT